MARILKSYKLLEERIVELEELRVYHSRPSATNMLETLVKEAHQQMKVVEAKRLKIK